MKKVILSLIAITTVTLSHAQVQFGAKAGVNIATLSGSDASEIPGKGSVTGLHIGGLVSIPVSESFSVQPELLYSMQGVSGSESGVSETENLNYINVPVLAKYTIAKGFAVEAGPQVGFLLSANVKGGGESEDVKSSSNSVDFSVAVGASYLLTESNIGFDARYNIGLSSTGKAEDGDAAPKTYNSVIQLGVFYMFGGKTKK